MIYDFQRAGMLKRAPAWLLDIILLITLATGLMAGLAHIVAVDEQITQWDDIRAKYEETYEISFGVSSEEYEQLSQEKKDAFQAANDALAKDNEAKAVYELLMNKILLMISLGVLGAFLLLEFCVPLLLKNGQTLGKKIFGVALMREDSVKVTPFMMFARTVLGKYTIETMIPLALIMFMGGSGLLAAVVILLAEIIIPFATRKKQAIHDLLACTVAVDLGSQMIFDTREAMEEYHKQFQEEKEAEAGE